MPTRARDHRHFEPSPDLGEVREELEAEFDSDPIAIGFNPRYVVELLTRMTSGCGRGTGHGWR